jgi:sialate O-acetylesterase
MIYTQVSSFQVLQRDATNTAQVLVNGQVTSWNVGGPYTIGNASHVLVGDIWVMAGQSNMRGHGFFNDMFSGHSLIPSPEADIHLFDSTEQWRVASEPTHALRLSKRSVHHTLPDPTVSNPSVTAYRGASLGLAFAKRYKEINYVPVGLIASAHGGTTLENWKRPDVLDEKSADTTLYGAMMDRIRETGGNIAGVLWYQGESDADTKDMSDSYGERFKLWLDTLRKDTRADLPVAFVQIGPHRVDNKPDMITGWMTVQDEQRKLFGMDDRTAGVSGVDCELDDRLHVSASGLDKIGYRLANAATLTLQNRATHATPLCKRAYYQEGFTDAGEKVRQTVKLEFSGMEDRSFPLDLNVQGFGIKNGSSSLILKVQVERDGKSVRIYFTSTPPHPFYIEYGMNQYGNLVADDGMAVAAFKGLAVTQNK